MKDAGMSEKNSLVLLSPLGKGHHVYEDQYYTTYQFLEYMVEKAFYRTGTLQINTENFPKEIKRSKIVFQEVKNFISEKRSYMCNVERQESQEISDSSTIQTF